MPLTAVAAASVTVENPTIAGLGTQVTVTGLRAGEEAHVSIQPPVGDEILLPIRADGQGRAQQELRGSEVQRAGTYRLRLAAEGKALTPAQIFEVLPDSLDIRRSTVETDRGSLLPDGRDTVKVMVMLRDRYDNPLPGRPATILSSRTADDLSAEAQQTDDAGTLRFHVSTNLPGTVTLRAIDLLSGNALADAVTIDAGSAPVGGDRSPAWYRATAAPLSSPPPWDERPSARMYYAQTSTFDVLDHFEITAPATLPAGEEAPRMIVRAVDRTGHTVEDYVGTIVFSSTDPGATLPNFGRYTFRDRDLGQKEFPLVLKFERGGTQRLRIEDLNDPTIVGETTMQVEGGHSASTTITVTSHKSGDTVKTTDILVEGKGPTFANLIVMGGAEDTVGATDKDGNFSIPVTLNPEKRDFTIRVRDDAGRNDSGPIDLTLDTDGPSIGAITFSPEHPNAGDKVLLVIASEPALESVMLRWQPRPSSSGDDVRLVENPTATGSYQAFFTAPEQGAYQPLIIATDGAGNATEIRTSLTVGSSLPMVTNLRGEVHANAVALEWDTVEGAIDGYRLYVGEHPDNFLYTLDTGRATTKATVAGLVPGRTYFFAVTAVAGKAESGQKSNVVQLEIPGLVLKVTPGNATLLLEWQPPKVSLQSYLLEYGVRDGQYTEKRMLPARKTDDGRPQAFTLTDLLNGIPYVLRLTPITITGDTLTDLAATGKGTPVDAGQGFQPSPSDPIPFDPGRESLRRTPAQPTTGLPPAVWFVAVAVTLGFCGFQWHRRKMLRHTAAFLAAIQTQYHQKL